MRCQNEKVGACCWSSVLTHCQGGNPSLCHLTLLMNESENSTDMKLCRSLSLLGKYLKHLKCTCLHSLILWFTEVFSQFKQIYYLHDKLPEMVRVIISRALKCNKKDFKYGKRLWINMKQYYIYIILK